ncbi:hypothetical protein [Providencia rettgeri]|uniref:hypothetical protein n=1 Tax=Providencia rettgeri TaxID=587 RepID=UPI00235FDDA5|nr:hypothetical protein [Providencia rettgeri]
MSNEKSALERLAEATGKDLSKIESFVIRCQKMAVKRAIFNMLIDSMIDGALDFDTANKIRLDINREFEKEFGTINILF